MDEWVRVTVGRNQHRIPKPVADVLGLTDGSVHEYDERLLDRIIAVNWEYIRAREDRLGERARMLQQRNDK